MDNRNILAASGFVIEWTGGGCESLQKARADGCMVWVTDQSGCNVPTWADWMVGVYPADWEGDGGQALFMACSDDSACGYGLTEALADALAQ